MSINFESLSTELLELSIDDLDNVVGGKEPYSNLYLREPTLMEKIKAAEHGQ